MATDAPGQRLRPAAQVGWYVLLSLLALIVLAPLYFVVVRAISDPSEAFLSSVLTPQGVRFDGFREAWTRGNMGSALVRSLVVTLLITTLQLGTSVLAAYAFAFLRFPFKRLTFAVFMATMLLPLEVTLLPNLQTMRDLGWFDTYQGLVVPFAASAFGTFLIRQGFGCSKQSSLPVFPWLEPGFSPLAA